ncbi:MAG: hypothetical protein LBQ65_06185 [Tannerellaceae bacterium]|jgi:ABC-type oligopeptide transport system substrate-binding subunit|nr:hypothetical protein [Tannerellaceae bacterium]
MKKIVLMLATAAFVLSFAACGGKSNTQTEAATDESSEPQTEETLAPAAPTSAKETDVLLKKYNELVKKALALYAKLAAGDTSVIEEYAKVTNEMSDLSDEVIKAFPEMTPEQKEQFNELSRRIAEALK